MMMLMHIRPTKYTVILLRIHQVIICINKCYTVQFATPQRQTVKSRIYLIIYVFSTGKESVILFECTSYVCHLQFV